MSDTVATIIESLPSEVTELAQQLGVTDYLTPVVELSQSVFPNTTVELERHDDPEIPNESWIVVNVHVEEPSVDKVIDQTEEWHRRMYEFCPVHHRCAFSIMTLWHDD